jgi:hypothetical protein
LGKDLKDLIEYIALDNHAKASAGPTNSGKARTANTSSPIRSTASQPLINRIRAMNDYDRVLEKLAFQRTGQAEIDGKKFDGLIPPTLEQLELFTAFRVPKPHHQNLHDPMMQ